MAGTMDPARQERLRKATVSATARARRKQTDLEAYANELAYHRIYGLGYRAGQRSMARIQQRVRQIACCATWQPITTLPHRCGKCGQVYLAPSSHEVAFTPYGTTPSTTTPPMTVTEPFNAKGH